MLKKWLPIGLLIFIILGVLISKVYVDLSHPKKENHKQTQAKTKEPPKKTELERNQMKDDTVKNFLVMLSNGDYKVPKLFDKKVFGKDFNDMNGDEVLVTTESIFRHFLQGHRFYSGRILSVNRGKNSENDVYHVQIEFYQTNYIDQKEMDIEVNQDGKIVTPIKMLNKQHENIEE